MSALRQPPRGTRLRGLLLACVLVGGAAVGWRAWSRDDADVWLARTATRPLEARLSVEGADGHRPYLSGDEGEVGSRSMPLQAMRELEERRDLRGIAAAYLVRGVTRQARAYLTQLPASPERHNDLAVAALLEGQYSEALDRLEQALDARPGYAQALWNKGLVLRQLGLPLTAAMAFEEAGRSKEPGWSEEAARQAAALREPAEARRGPWMKVRDGLRAYLTSPSDEPLPSPELLRSSLPSARDLFYEMVRIAPGPEQARALRQHAEVLDGLHGGTHLSDYVRQVEARDFGARGPLAREYARAYLAPTAPKALLERLRASGEKDLLLGALLRSEPRNWTPEELELLRRGTRDPWLSLRLEMALAQVEVREGKQGQAETRLRSALGACRSGPLVSRCLDLQAQLCHLYTEANRLSEAHALAREGWAESRRTGEWNHERRFLQLLGQIARYRHDPVLASAYLAESLAHDPQDKKQLSYVHRNLAHFDLMRFRIASAREHFDEALKSGMPLGDHGAEIVVELSRLAPRPGNDEQVLHDALETLKKQQPQGEQAQRDGRGALMLSIQGRFEIERDVGKGRKLLWDAIKEAEKLERSVTMARDARANSYSTLVMKAGAERDFREVFALAARRLEIAAPERCALVAAVDLERTVVAARGPSGETRGHFDATRREPLGNDVSGLVPPALVELVRPCDQVDVLALSPLETQAGLLPPELAWSYRVGRWVASSRPPGPDVHLVVANVQPPAARGLVRLPAWTASHPRGATPISLSGLGATPTQVRAELPRATGIEIHAHGLIDQRISDAALIALSPDPDGQYGLTAKEIVELNLARSPTVLLPACGAARMTPFVHESISLPAAFVAAGAREVLAATADIPDSAGLFFAAVRDRIDKGEDPAVALRDERLRELAKGPGARWVKSVLLYR